MKRFGISPAAFPEYFLRLSLRQRVILSQLPLSGSVLLVVLLAAAFHQDTLGNRAFIAGLVLHGLILLACTETPWDRLPARSHLSIPVLDFVSIALIREGAGASISGVGILLVFPVIWLAASGWAPRAALLISFLGPLGVVLVPQFLAAAPLDAGELTGSMLLPLIMPAVGLTVRAVTSGMEAQQQALQAKDAQLRSALAASSEKERLLNTIVEAVGVGVLAVDRDGNDILMNRQQRRNHALAAPAGHEDPNETQLLLYGPDRVTALPEQERPVRRAIAGETFSDYLVWIGQGASQRVMSTTARAVRDEAGDYTGSVIAFTDVSDMVAALAAKDDFVANVSHEFRTPLTSILGYLELAGEASETLPAELSEYLAVARRNADRLLTLVSDLLATVSDSLTIDLETIDLSELIAGCVASAAVRAEETGVQLVNETVPGVVARIDSTRIGQVLDNLLSNAIKYSPDGGTVTVRAWTAGPEVVVEVQDTGMGMAKEDQAAVFTKFFRAGSVRNTAIPGVGLGLLITKSIIDRHDGTISVQSTPGAGSTFTVTLPSRVPAPAYR